MIARLSRGRGENGFTLVELLVVIAILGILSAVVVFAVQGVGDRGQDAAVQIDERIIRTAEEAHCAQYGYYATAQELVAKRLLTEVPKYHTISLESGGPCQAAGVPEASGYSVECTDVSACGGSGGPSPTTSTSTSTSTTSTTTPTTCGPVSLATWTAVTSPGALNLYGVSFISETVGWAVGGESPGSIFHTSNGGASWSKQKDVPFVLKAVHFLDSNRGWAAGGGGIVRTEDGGLTWSNPAATDAQGFWGISMAPDGRSGFAASDSGVYSTTDGTIWTKSRPASSPAYYRAVATPAPGVSHVVEGYRGDIYGTRDGGATWVLEKPGETDPSNPPFPLPGPLALSFANESAGHAAGGGGRIYGTATGGLVWTTEASCTDMTLFGVAFSDANRGVAVGDGGTVVRTVDGGTTWGRDGSLPTTNRLTAVSRPSAGTAYAVGDGGVVLKGTFQ